MKPPTTLEQVELELKELRDSLSTLIDLQKLELLEIRRSGRHSSKHLSSVGNRLFEVILLFAVGGGCMFFYYELDKSEKNKVASSVVNQAVPVLLGLVSAYHLIGNKKEQKQLEKGNSDDEEKDEEVKRLLVNKYLEPEKSDISKLP